MAKIIKRALHGGGERFRFERGSELPLLSIPKNVKVASITRAQMRIEACGLSLLGPTY